MVRYMHTPKPKVGTTVRGTVLAFIPDSTLTTCMRANRSEDTTLTYRSE